MSENFPFMDAQTKESLEKWLKKHKKEYFSEASKLKEDGLSDLAKCHRYAAYSIDTILWHMKYAMEKQENPCNQRDCNYTTVGFLVYDVEHRDVLISLDPETWHPIIDVKEKPLYQLDFPAVYNSYNEALSVSNDFDSLYTTPIRVMTCEKSGKALWKYQHPLITL